MFNMMKHQGNAAQGRVIWLHIYKKRLKNFKIPTIANIGKDMEEINVSTFLEI